METQLSIEDKARILDWLLTPSQSRTDRSAVIAKSISKSHLTSLFEFRVWGTREEFIQAVLKKIEHDNNNNKSESDRT